MTIEIILTNDNLIHPIVVLCEEENLSNITKLFTLFQSSNNCIKALSSLSKTPSVKLNFTRDDIKFQGHWLAEEKEIHVKKNLPLEKMLQTFIFELCNANNPKLQTSKLKYSNFITAEDYAIYVETAEHQSFKQATLLYMDIFSKNPGELETPSNVELKQLRMLNDDNTYLTYVKSNGHYDNYVKNYNKAMRKTNSFFDVQHKISQNEDFSTYELYLTLSSGVNF